MIRAYIKELPRLEAEEALHQVAIMAVGTGNMKKEDRRRTLARWQRDASPAPGQRPKLSREQRAYMLSQMGIKIEWQKS